MNETNLLGSPRPAVSLLAGILVGGLMTLCTSAFAQETATPSAEQLELHDQALDALARDDTKTAIGLFESVNRLGEVNIFLLNHGRALTVAGRCEDAKRIFERVPASPAIADPPREAVLEKLEVYKAKMLTECPGTLEIACQPNTATVTVGEESHACTGKLNLDLAPGRYTIEVVADGHESSSREVEIVAMERAALDVQLAPAVVETPAPAPQKEDDATLAIAGWVTVGAGGAALLAGIVYDATALGATLDDLETAGNEGDAARYDDLQSQAESEQTTVLILGFGGAAVLTTGAVLLVLDATSGRDEPRSEVTLTPWWSSDGAGVATGFRF